MPDERPVAIANTSPLQYLEEEPRIVVTPSGLELLEAHSGKTQARRGLALVS